MVLEYLMGNKIFQCILRNCIYVLGLFIKVEVFQNINEDRDMRCLAIQFLFFGSLGLGLISPNVFAENGVFWKTDEKNKTASVLVDWCKAANASGCLAVENEYKEIRPRITSEYKVTMHVRSFNFVGYDYKIDTESNEVKVYTYLNDIWGDLLGNFGAFGASGAAVNSKVDNYWTGIQKSKSDFVEMIQNGYQNLPAYMNTTDITNFTRDVKGVDNAITSLKGLRDSAFAEASAQGGSPNQIQAFILADGEFAKFREIANDFIQRAKKSTNGSSKSLGKQKAGYIVSVTLTPNVREGTGVGQSLSAIAFDYPVQSKYPLLFHVGFTHANVDNLEYEKVRSLKGEDLFLKVKENDGLQNFSAFLSYPLGGKELDNAEWYGTLGTDITNIGDNVYGGLSYKFNEKWLVSFGVTYSLATKAEGETIEGEVSGDAGEETPAEPSRTLYQIVKEDRETSWFLSVSYTIF